MLEIRAADWNKLIAEQEASGQGVYPFCQERGIKENAFYRWRKRFDSEARLEKPNPIPVSSAENGRV